MSTALFDRTCDSDGATRAAAAAFAATLASGAVVGLCGPLGAGKTAFVRGVLAALHGTLTVFHGSPTFALVHEYRTTAAPVFHFDFYRIKNAAEIAALGWDDYCTPQSICLIEWAARFADVLPPHTRWVHCEIIAAHVRRFHECATPPEAAAL
jgi:tRNA threonylcarbamoyladenosine biosynthesis protein TsaE